MPSLHDMIEWLGFGEERRDFCSRSEVKWDEA